MVAAWQEISSVRRSVPRWAVVAAAVLIVACGGERDAAPPGDGSMASTDTATAAAPAADTAAPAPDTAASKPSAATQPTKPAPAPAAKPAPKPTTAAKPAPPTQPAATARDTAQARANPPSQATAPPQESAPAAQQTPQTATAPLRDEYHRAPKDTVDQATYDGWKQYNLNCARCHGEDVLGSTIAPHLVMSLKPDGPIPTQEAFMQVVCAGRPEKGMPAWCALGMEPAKINDIYAYVKGRSAGKLGPGRPALREGS